MARRRNIDPGWLVVAGISTVFVLDAERKRRDATRLAQLERRVRALYRLISGQVTFRVPPLVFVNSRAVNAASDGHQILVSRVWLKGLLARMCDTPQCRDAVVVGILAHELGHHANRDALRPLYPHDVARRHARELHADYFAGAITATLRIDPNDFARALIEISTSCGHSHPCPDQRIPALRRGFLDHFQVEAYFG